MRFGSRSWIGAGEACTVVIIMRFISGATLIERMSPVLIIVLLLRDVFIWPSVVLYAVKFMAGMHIQKGVARQYQTLGPREPS